jgi:membrane peptidoglycan carboxypeptidase
MAKYWTLTTKTFTEEANHIKEVYLQRMKDENIITQDQFDEMNKHCIVIADKSFFGAFWDKILWKNSQTEANIIVVKVLG